jgi:hypothetical protein
MDHSDEAEKLESVLRREGYQKAFTYAKMLKSTYLEASQKCKRRGCPKERQTFVEGAFSVRHLQQTCFLELKAIELGLITVH